jgi:hypothetical protein
MSLLFADPADLHRTARHLRHHADDVRRRAASLASRAEQARWHSPGATAFRSQVYDVTGRMRATAAHLDAAAASLDRHATRVGHALAMAEHVTAGVLHLVAL